ncbi:MAG TPA: ribonuclease, partial [Bacteroidales bacterium]|nr:ribonuclease [Bacteroidales bacterium]
MVKLSSLVMEKKKQKKIFVLDTNVLLHDFRCIYNFNIHDVVIPIVALEELDKFKKGNEMINFMAREFTRELDKLSGTGLFNKGISLGKQKGKLFIEIVREFSEKGKRSFPENIPDHRILAIAEWLTKEKKPQKVILVTKDINLRMKAKALNILAEDYENDKVIDIDEKIYRSIEVINDVDNRLIQQFYNNKIGLPVELFDFTKKVFPHEYFILKNETSSALAHYNPVDMTL